jgi:hypothetical protein
MLSMHAWRVCGHGAQPPAKVVATPGRELGLWRWDSAGDINHEKNQDATSKQQGDGAGSWQKSSEVERVGGLGLLISTYAAASCTCKLVGFAGLRWQPTNDACAGAGIASRNAT